MAPSALNRKRKAITHDSSEAEEVALSDGGSDLELSKINGTLTYSDEEDHSSDEEEWLDSEDEDTDITEEEKDDEERDLDSEKVSQGQEDQSSGDRKPAAMDSADEPNYTTTTDANGNTRYLYQAIDPVYDSDDSDAPATTNTIGNIPMTFYDSYPHIGYDINGKKISRPATGEALDALLDTIDIPKGWTGLTDPATGQPLQLSQEELEVLKRIQMNEVPDGYDPYPETIEYFSSKTEIMPLSAAPEPKRRFIPSKHEAVRVMKIVKAIREGRIMPYKPPGEIEEEDEDIKRYDIWANEAPRPDHPMHIPAPKLPPPGYDESYHPPAEYLPDDAERKAWEEMNEEDRPQDYLPTNHDSLRKVPGYENFVKDKFERCLDLYLAPRVRRNKLNIDPESLLPKLPSPEELRPFPTTCATIFRGHEGRVRSLAIDPSGILLASGGDDGTVRVWELLTGRQLWSVELAKGEAVNVVCWRPNPEVSVLAAASGETIFLLVPPTNDPEVEQASREVLDAGWGHAAANSNPANRKSEAPAQWTRPGPRLEDAGALVQISVQHTVKSLTWHRRGDHFSSVSPAATSRAVAIHTLSKHLTQLPFRRLKGLAQCAAFHPTKPHFFVATQRSIRIYDLAAQTLVSTLQPGARWLSSLAIHPSGTHLLAGAYDRRLLWHDLELSSRPYRTLRYHERAIRAVRFHPGGLPLFADASDDATVQIFHARVVGDAMENVAIVPLKVLRGHRIRGALGVLDVEWHPREPWCVSAGADGTCRLWM